MESLHFNYTEISSYCKTKRRNQNKEFSFPFFVGSSPDPSTENMIVRKNSLFWCRVERGSEARKSPMRTRKYRITTRSARCRLFNRFAIVQNGFEQSATIHHEYRKERKCLSICAFSVRDPTSKTPACLAWESNQRNDVSLRTSELCPAALSTFMNEVK